MMVHAEVHSCCGIFHSSAEWVDTYQVYIMFRAIDIYYFIQTPPQPDGEILFLTSAD